MGIPGTYNQVGTYNYLNFFSKDSNGYLYLRGPYNRGVPIIPRVRYSNQECISTMYIIHSMPPSILIFQYFY